MDHVQLKSEVRCKVCNYKSMRFDPFTFLSLPLPMESTVDLEIVGKVGRGRRKGGEGKGRGRREEGGGGTNIKEKGLGDCVLGGKKGVEDKESGTEREWRERGVKEEREGKTLKGRGWEIEQGVKADLGTIVTLCIHVRSLFLSDSFGRQSAGEVRAEA